MQSVLAEACIVHVKAGRGYIKQLGNCYYFCYPPGGEFYMIRWEFPTNGEDITYRLDECKVNP